MWLRNFYNSLACMVLGGGFTSTSNLDDNNISLKKIDGSFASNFGNSSIWYFYPVSEYGKFYQHSSGSMGSLNYGLIFGSGDTKVTYDDYKLTEPLTNKCTITNLVYGTPTYDAETKTWSCTVQFDLKNTSSTAAVIKEVGLRNYSPVLLYREVLDEPITLGAGITMAYNHTFKFTMPVVNS